ncbi:MAG: PA14 domain-containing protein, partial [Planctomycetota bacterium]
MRSIVIGLALVGLLAVAMPAQAQTDTYIFGAPPGTTIQTGTDGLIPWITKGTLPEYSILRSVSIDAILESTEGDSWASDINAYLDPNPEAPGTAALLQVGGYGSVGNVTKRIDWANGQGGPDTPVNDTKTDADWSDLGDIDLNAVQLSIGNDYSPGNWSGTISVTYDVPTPLTWNKTVAEGDWNSANWTGGTPGQVPTATEIAIVEGDGLAAANLIVIRVTGNEAATALPMRDPGPDEELGNYVWITRTTGWSGGAPDDTFGSLTVSQRIDGPQLNNILVMDQGTSLNTGTGNSVISGMMYFGSEVHPGADGAPGGGDDVTIPIEDVVVNTPGNLTILHRLDDITLDPAEADRRFVKQGAGTLSIDSTTAVMTAINTIFRIEEGTLALGGADPLGGSTAPVQLAGATLKIAGEAALISNQLDYGFYEGAAESTIVDIDDGVANGQNGGLFNLDPDPSSKWTTEVWQDDDIDDQYSQMWSGIFTAPETGTYEFFVHGDDYETLWIDVDRNGEFEAGDLISKNISAEEDWWIEHTETVALTEGQSYGFALAHREGGGGDWVEFEIGLPSGGGSLIRANPGLPAQDGWWASMGHLAVVLPGADLVVSAPSVLELESSGESVLGALTMENGATLTTTGNAEIDKITFTGGTSIDAAEV